MIAPEDGSSGMKSPGSAPVLNIIGGMFGLEIGDPAHSASVAAPVPILAGRHLRLATARSAFTLLARSLRPSVIWLPSYLCPSIIPCFLAAPCPVRFYAVGEDLRVADRNWLSDVQRGDLVVFIDYFGFNQWEEFGVLARCRGAWVIEDACQALANPRFSDQAHFVIASPRKFVGVPDGGILLAQGDAGLPESPASPAPEPWWLEAYRASLLRGEFDHHGGPREWFPLFQRTEAEGPIEPARMSELSALILDRIVDWPELRRRRRANYEFLAGALRGLALLPELPADVVPLGCPVRVPGRDKVREKLFKQEIYPPIHWRLAGAVPESFVASHRLAADILTLPCDQRYALADMERMVAAVLSALA